MPGHCRLGCFFLSGFFLVEFKAFPDILNEKPLCSVQMTAQAELAYGACNPDFGSWGDRFIQLGD